jgi:D-proline reductase (dithiol) PrdB
VGLVSVAIEEQGVPTVTVSMEDGVEAPRVARVPFPYNFPMGRDEAEHRGVAAGALTLLEELDGPGERALEIGYFGSRRDDARGV